MEKEIGYFKDLNLTPLHEDSNTLDIDLLNSKLNQAAANKGVKETLDITQLGPDDEMWNTVYALNDQMNEKSYVIKTTKLSRKDGESFTQADGTGYLAITAGEGPEANSSTTNKKGKFIRLITGKLPESFNIKMIDIVSDIKQATMIPASRADDFAKALKRTKNLVIPKGGISSVPVTIAGVTDNNYKKFFVNWYFSACVADKPVSSIEPNASKFIEKSIDLLPIICDRRKNPLQGNHIFKALAIPYNKNLGFDATPANVRTLYNLMISDIRGCTAENIINGNTFMGRLVFNNSLYNNKDTEVQEIARAYNSALTETWKNKAVTDAKGNLAYDSKNLAKWIIVKNGDGTDSLKNVLEDENDNFPELPKLSLEYKDIVGYEVRKLSEINTIYKTLENKDLTDSSSDAVETEEAENEAHWYLRVGNVGTAGDFNISQVYELKGENHPKTGGITGSFENVKFEKDNKAVAVVSVAQKDNKNKSKGKDVLLAAIKELLKGSIEGSKDLASKYFKVPEDKDKAATLKVDECTLTFNVTFSNENYSWKISKLEIKEVQAGQEATAEPATEQNVETESGIEGESGVEETTTAETTEKESGETESGQETTKTSTEVEVTNESPKVENTDVIKAKQAGYVDQIDPVGTANGNEIQGVKSYNGETKEGQLKPGDIVYNTKGQAIRLTASYLAKNPVVSLKAGSKIYRPNDELLKTLDNLGLKIAVKRGKADESLEQDIDVE